MAAGHFLGYSNLSEAKKTGIGVVFVFLFLAGAAESTFLSFFAFLWFEACFGPSVYREMIGKWEQ